MKALCIKVTLVTVLLAGGVCGCACRHNAAAKLATEATYANALLGVTDAFGPLRALRAGNTNEAIEELENRLDQGVIELSTLLPEQPDSKKRAAYNQVLRKVRDYRVSHPWKSTISPQVEHDVAEALASIPEEGAAK